MTAHVSDVLCSEALEMVGRGWSVFPLHSVHDGTCSCSRGADCESKGKHPRTAHGVSDATTDEAQVLEWWERWPDANIGVATGGGLMVLDVDPRHDGTTEGLDLPDTLRVVTGGGGEHWYFTVPGTVPNSANVVGPGLDVRGDGGYVVAPPSVHESGRRYAWDAGAPDDEARAPEWLVALAKSKARERVRAESQEQPDALVAGGRNDGLTRMAGAMVRKGFGVGAVEAALLEENRDRCRPPLDDREVQSIARSVSRYGPSDPVTVEADDKRGGFLTGADLAQPLGEVPWLCRELEIAPGPPTMFAGRGYSGKTVALQSMALALASGLPVWGKFRVRSPVSVLHLDYEQGARLTTERYQRLAAPLGIGLEQLGNQLRVGVFPPYLDKPEGWAWLEKAVVGVGFCFVDALRGAIPGMDENSSESRKFLDMFGRVSERTGCTFGVVHHARKASEADARGADQTIRGTGAFFDACQSVLVMQANKGQMPRVHHEKARITGKPHPDFFLDVEDRPVGGVEDGVNGLCVQLTELGDRDPDQDVRDALLGALRAHPGMSRKKWLRATPGYRHVTLIDVVADLVEEGLVDESPGGRGGGSIYRVVG